MLEKYFIAIVPSDSLLSEIEDIKKYISKKYQSHGALQSPAHITLHMPFSYEKEEKLLTCIEAFKFKTPFSINLNGFGCFEPRVVFINVDTNDSLFLLQKELVQHIKKNLGIFNQSDDLKGFHPHITIAFRDLKKQTFYKIWEEYKTLSFSSQFSCNDIAVFKKENRDWKIYKRFHFTS
jgi:2'-5' RNA ligase